MLGLSTDAATKAIQSVYIKLIRYRVRLAHTSNLFSCCNGLLKGTMGSSMLTMPFYFLLAAISYFQMRGNISLPFCLQTVSRPFGNCKVRTFLFQWQLAEVACR